jgi:hypothetical protein
MKHTLVFPALFAIAIPVWGQAHAVLPIHDGTRILQSGSLAVEVGDPDDPSCRWNQGLRFSPAANVIQVRLNGREFCYAPKDGGRLTFAGGFPMEFDIGQESYQPDPPGYNEGKSGDPFLKIGVGILTRNSAAYNFSSSYPVVELATTTTTWEADRARFVQTLNGTANGYAYRLEEDVIVKNDSLIMHTVLSNTGTKPFTTEQYLHNFSAFSNRPVGPNYRVKFPYAIEPTPEVKRWEPPTLVPGGRKPVVENTNGAMTRLENTIVYSKAVSGVPKIWITLPEDYQGPDMFSVEQSDTGQRMIVDSTWRSAYVGIWTQDYNVSPEHFLIIDLAPGEQAVFTRTYRFFVDGSSRQDVDGDRVVNGRDLACLAGTWLKTPGREGWNAAGDISPVPDDHVDLLDLAVLGQTWGRSALDPQPAAHWSLDDGAGPVAADSVADRHGSLLGFPADDSQWVEGRIQGALNFDGADDVIEVGDYPGVGGLQARTVAAWLKVPDTPLQIQPLVAWGDDGPGASWALVVGDDGRLRLSNGAGFVAIGERPIEKDWYHVAVVLDPVDPRRPLISDVFLYLNGERDLIHDMVEAEIDTGMNGTLRIGGTQDPGIPTFLGILDEVAVYPYAICPTAIRQMAQR